MKSEYNNDNLNSQHNNMEEQNDNVQQYSDSQKVASLKKVDADKNNVEDIKRKEFDETP